MRILVSYLCILCFGLSFSNLVSGDEIDDFISRAMKKYPAWLLENKLDPFYADADYVPTIDYNDGTMKAKVAYWDVSVKHHSKISPENITVTRTVARDIQINYKLMNTVVFSGTYYTRGGFSWDNFDGQGPWSVTTKYSDYPAEGSLIFQVVIRGLKANPDCSLDMSSTVFTSKLEVHPTVVYENLNTGLYGGSVRMVLGRIAVDRLDEMPKVAPLQKLIDMYLSSLFAETPVCNLLKKV